MEFPIPVRDFVEYNAPEPYAGDKITIMPMESTGATVSVEIEPGAILVNPLTGEVTIQ